MSHFNSSLVGFLKIFKWNSIFFKYLKKFTLIIIIPIFLLSSVLYYFFSDSIKSSIESRLSENTINCQHTFNDTLDNVFNLMSMLSTENEFIVLDSLTELDYLNKDLQNSLNEFINKLKYFITYSHNIDSVHVYFNNTRHVFSTRHTASVEEFSKRSIIGEVINSVKNTTFYSQAKDENPDFINVYKATYANGKLQNVVIFTLDINYMLGEYIDRKEDSFCLYNGDTQIYNIGTLTPAASSQYNIFKIPRQTTHSGDLNFPMLKYSITYSNAQNEKLNAKLIEVMILCVIITLLIPFLISWFLSVEYCKKIFDITMKLQNEIDITPHTESKNEFEYIVKSITSITDRIAKTEAELTMQLVNLKKAQVSILQNQINPHFLFNTINSINVYIIDMFGEECEATVMLSNLSSMLSSLFNTNELFVSLEEEIKYAQSYINIEQIKHVNTFDVIWDIDPEVLNYRLIKLTLQPLLENALSHGIYPLRGDKRGKINVTVKQVNEKTQIIVEDNGVGISEENLSNIKYQLKNHYTPTTKHIGLNNINTRINYLYGSEATIDISSSESGTYVVLLLPLSE